MRRAALVTTALLLTAGCSSNGHVASSSSTSTTVAGSSTTATAVASTAADTQSAALKAAVSVYGTNYMAGHGDQLYEGWSARCQATQTEAQVEEADALANQLFAGVTMASYSAIITGKQAYVTTTYSAPKLDRAHQSWVFEDGKWRWDGC